MCVISSQSTCLLTAIWSTPSFITPDSCMGHKHAHTVCTQVTHTLTQAVRTPAPRRSMIRWRGLAKFPRATDQSNSRSVSRRSINQTARVTAWQTSRSTTLLKRRPAACYCGINTHSLFSGTLFVNIVTTISAISSASSVSLIAPRSTD